MKTPLLDALVVRGYATLWVAVNGNIAKCEPYKVRIKKPSKRGEK
jgi:hypothetical protein